MKTKALISFAVTLKLICVFVFSYAKRWFSHDAAHMFNEYNDNTNYMSRIMRKPVFRVYDQVQHKPGCAVTEDSEKNKGDCTIYVAETKALISCTVNTQLICVFVFAYAEIWFSHDAAHMYHTHWPAAETNC